jgi:hypothetical protein
MPFNDSSSALVAVMISNPYADAGNVGPENLGPQWRSAIRGFRRFKRIMALRSIASPVER